MTIPCPPVPHSHDPNAKTGLVGFGPQGFITGDSVLPYRITFENDPTATAPAQRVVITDPLNPNIDWSTLQFTEVGFGDNIITISAGSQHFQTTVSMTYNGLTFNVLIELGLNMSTGLITATFQSINPMTDLPPDVLTGFLPPEDGTGRGMGYFSYTVMPRAGLPTGTQVRNIATITFDVNPPITTDQVDENDPSQGVDAAKQDLNTVDAGAPTSSVAPLPATETSAGFTVTWSGQDDLGGSGVASYNVYVSDNGGPLTIWQSATTQTSATFDGVNGHSYAFYCVAIDNVGHVEATPIAPEASTVLHVTVGDVSVLVASSAPESKYGQTVTFTATVHSLTAGLPAPSGTMQFQIDGAPFGAPVALVGDKAVSASIATLPAGSHTITALYANDPNYHFNSGSAAQTVNKALLTVTANAESMTAGGALPTLTYTITGFVNGDGPSSLSSPVVVTTTATADSPPGAYPITIGGATSPNYAITFVPGTLTVTSPPLVTMTNVQEVFKKKHQVVQIIVDFSGPVNAGLADSLATYRLTIAGKHGSFTAKNAKVIALKSALYNNLTDSVALVPRKRFGLTKPVQLRVHGLLAWGDAVAVLSKQGVRIEARRQPGALPRLSIPAVQLPKYVGSRERLLDSLVTAALGAWGSDAVAPKSGRDDLASGPLITIVGSTAPKANGGPGDEHRVPLPARSEFTRLEATRLPTVGHILLRHPPTKRSSNRFPGPKSDRPADYITASGGTP